MKIFKTTLPIGNTSNHSYLNVQEPNIIRISAKRVKNFVDIFTILNHTLNSLVSVVATLPLSV